MNIGDIVYVYLFDLEKSILHMDQLRNDRFGRVTAITKRPIAGTNFNDLVYHIKTQNKVLEYVSSNINYSVISIPDLLNVINKADLSEKKRKALIEQIQKNVQQI